MAKNIAPQIVRETRRQAVATLLAKRPRITQREIWAYLAGTDRGDIPRMTNPDTGGAFSLGTINSDIQALRAEYREKTNDARDEWAAKLLSWYEDLIREAQIKGEMSEVRHNIKAIRELLGVDAPEKHEITGEDGGPIMLKWPEEDD